MAANLRKTDLIDPKVQGALVRRLALHWLAFTATAAVLALVLQWMSNPFQPWSTLIANAWWNTAPLLLVLVCLIPVFVFDSIKFSHRFVGPVFRFRQITRALADGEPLERIEFRGTDFWKELAQDLNRVADRLKQTTAQGAADKQ